MKQVLLHIKDLQVSVEDKKIIKGISLSLAPGKIYALMGPNGSGKSSLANVIVGHPGYKVNSGSILFKGNDLLTLQPDERARSGIFLSFQDPKSIPGVIVSNFLRTAYKAVKKKNIRVFDFQKILREKIKYLKMPESFLDRYVNEGFSGGEKKKLEILQAMVL